MFIHLSSVFSKYFPEILGVFRITFRLYRSLLRGIKGFGGPDKEMRSISRADKLCRSNEAACAAIRKWE
jgi:hypothetical protein